MKRTDYMMLYLAGGRFNRCISADGNHQEGNSGAQNAKAAMHADTVRSDQISLCNEQHAP